MTAIVWNCYFIIFEVLWIIANKVILLWAQANNCFASLFGALCCSLSSETCSTVAVQHPQTVNCNESSHKLVPTEWSVFLIITCFQYEHNVKKKKKKQLQDTGLNFPLWVHKNDGSNCWESICSEKGGCWFPLSFLMCFPINGLL